MLNPFRSREALLSAAASRLTLLLRQSENPQAEMRAIERRLNEEGLAHWSAPSGISPEKFAHVMIRDNPALHDAIGDLRNEFRLEAIETPGDLVSRLLPAFNDHE